MNADTVRLLKMGSLAIAALLFIIGGFLDPGTDYDTTVTMWGIGFALITLVLLLDYLPATLGGPGRTAGGAGP
jgi:hypothetical protein